MPEYSTYDEGRRRAWMHMLQTCLHALGVDDPVATHAAWVLERQEALAVLRTLCASHGNNAWEDSLSLADILERHLGRYLTDDDQR